MTYAVTRVLQVPLRLIPCNSKMKEKDIETYLVGGWASATRGEMIKFPPLFYAGFPDRIGLAPGAVIVFVETKAPGKFARPLQAYIHRKLIRWGFKVYLIDTKEDALELCNTYRTPTN